MNKQSSEPSWRRGTTAVRHGRAASRQPMHIVLGKTCLHERRRACSEKLPRTEVNLLPFSWTKAVHRCKSMRWWMNRVLSHWPGFCLCSADRMALRLQRQRACNKSQRGTQTSLRLKLHCQVARCTRIMLLRASSRCMTSSCYFLMCRTCLRRWHHRCGVWIKRHRFKRLQAARCVNHC